MTAEAGGMSKSQRARVGARKSLHRTKPGPIPVEQPTKFDLVVNLPMAKAIALSHGTIIA
jgi:hypothetical protein